jgi:hypothetical protein
VFRTYLPARLVPAARDELIEVCGVGVDEGQEMEMWSAATLELQTPDHGDATVFALHPTPPGSEVLFPDGGVIRVLTRIGKGNE